MASPLAGRIRRSRTRYAIGKGLGGCASLIRPTRLLAMTSVEAMKEAVNG
jgi:hypothetical protein